MINLKTPEEIAIMAEGGKIHAEVMKKAIQIAQPGILKKDLDRLIEQMILDFKAEPSFKNYHGYSYSTCLSLNNEIVHGIPDKTKLKSGDILGIDIGIKFRGYHVDAACTIGIGKISESAKNLIDITSYSLQEAIKRIKPGVKLGVIQKTIESIIESKDYCLVRSYTGHGIGKTLQESPIIPNYFGMNSDLILEEGMTICLEPMVIIGKKHGVIVKPDEWTAISESGQLSAHFEHTIVVTRTGSKILTNF